MLKVLFSEVCRDVLWNTDHAIGVNDHHWSMSRSRMFSTGLHCACRSAFDTGRVPDGTVILPITGKQYCREKGGVKEASAETEPRAVKGRPVYEKD